LKNRRWLALIIFLGEAVDPHLLIRGFAVYGFESSGMPFLPTR